MLSNIPTLCLGKKVKYYRKPAKGDQKGQMPVIRAAKYNNKLGTFKNKVKMPNCMATKCNSKTA